MYCHAFDNSGWLMIFPKAMNEFTELKSVGQGIIPTVFEFFGVLKGFRLTKSGKKY